jgi:hypothetical protein
MMELLRYTKVRVYFDEADLRPPYQERSLGEEGLGKITHAMGMETQFLQPRTTS